MNSLSNTQKRNNILDELSKMHALERKCQSNKKQNNVVIINNLFITVSK